MKKEKKPRVRLDALLVERGLCASRERARALILAGAVLVDETRADKPGSFLSPDASVRLRTADHPYVSRGGVKLQGALETFSLSVRDMVCLDVGASTGGFTDCLLQAGARKVYALDVGYGQLAWKLRQDPRVVPIERTNIRIFDGKGLDGPVDLVTIDASFISLRLVIPAALRWLKPGGILLALIKPQFEAGRENVGKGGVVRDPVAHRQVVEEVERFCRGEGLDVRGTCESSLPGPAGNREFFILATAPPPTDGEVSQETVENEGRTPESHER
ncbi:MAG: TlyA family rRNA (cytidine-2'-O)-methyltransferase [Deltaproteobacteria bacterium HGW-Deltaproteobacteria-19]|jgi:23S rRNA (cytidine1920-2'-O)/16S rRNA (cytidine1409-2'-O)-methyltransferase|nr:MAG: TlyA family rRNA (cytidine-2'-O)-methyltransferase [Deltaproteobacteria bacterium HGW-Deltaproteobacteria-19]